jgi:pimeloyl-ACP methyl ester carboxylesterase
VAGQGTPVVLLHGLAGSGRYWGAAFDDLAATCQLIVPDLLGFGLSPRPPEPLSAAAHADAVAALLGEVAGGTPAVVAGHSAGCLVALTLARRHPERVAAVVGFAPPLFPDPADARAAIRRSGLAGRLIASDRTLAWRLLAAAHRLRRPTGRLATLVAPHLPAALLHGTLTHTWPTYRETLEALVLSADPEQTTWLQLPQLPIHLVAGTADRFLDLNHLRRTATAPTVTLSVWPNAPHDLPLTDPAGCRTEILMVVERSRR